LSLLARGVRQATIDLSSEVSLARSFLKNPVRRDTLPTSLEGVDSQEFKKPSSKNKILGQELERVVERQSRSKTRTQGILYHKD